MAQPTPEEMAHWPPPNYTDPETRVSAVLGVLISTTALMLLFTAIVISLLGCIACKYGIGYHIWDIKPGWAVIFSKIAYSALIVLGPCVSLTKISICITYLRIFPSRANRIFCHSLIAFLVCWMLASVLAETFQCTPVGSYWDLNISNRKCINLKAYLFGTAATNTFSDILVYLWPARQLWDIQLPLKQRISLIFVFTLGCIVCVAGIIRMWNFSVYFASTDYFWEGAISWIAQGIEYNLGIVCGCLPGVKPLLSSIFPAVFGSSNQTSKVQSRSQRRPQSFAFQTLSGAGDGANQLARTDEAGTGELSGGNYAWSGGGDSESISTVPERGIRVGHAITVRVEAIESEEGVKANGADAGSEEWIMEQGKGKEV
ncbi:hypothetical protein K432DRAFT_350062 [Lepidopterella palustris CBS 459.81]|uniref:Rhodopsin domain-containing protein n=1 Tax=Lepidopterella palustris CBS 459.81 TaxID=1314670 RepID=A0A8E2EDA1_9PEZI|nr:hypothetical protein K432DRAFT_350062 [Lepidopterella palustris CBS 459.81]